MLLARTSLLVPALLLAACGGGTPPPVGPGSGAAVVAAPDAGPATPPATPAIATAEVSAETTITTGWGATLAVPATWWVGQTADLVRLEDPERDVVLHLLVVDAPDRDHAFAAAWQRVDPGFALPVAQAVDLPASDGWDGMAQTAYVTPTEQSRLVVAFGRRTGGTWHVALLDGKAAAFERRGAQLNALIEDMKVPGIEKESWAGKVAQLDADHLAAFDAFVEQARVAAGVPGVAVAIVHGGKIVAEKGYGVRALGKKAKPVAPGTAFMIGSTSKSLTTLLMARLVDLGTLTWATPVTTVLPWFTLGDEATTKALTLQYTVCACTGMPRQDLEFIFEYAGWDAEKRLASMKTMKPTTGFGETFQYSNLLVATGGYVAAHAYAPKQKLGPAYDAAMQKLVFAPLGMKSTTLDFAKATKGDWAHPHGQNLDLGWVETSIDYEKAVAALRPAGGVWSTAHDMAQYLLLELAGGKTVKGKQLVSEANLLHRREPQVKIDEDDAYGLGLMLSNDHGVRVVHHGGNMLGFTSDMFLLPDADVGVVVLTNAGSANAFRGAVRRRFLELVFDGTPEAERDLTEALARDQQAAAEQAALLVAKPEAAWVDGVVGSWTDPSLGAIEVRRDGDGLVIDAGEWKTTATEEIDRDGTAKLITTGAPFAGFTLVPGGTADAPTLVLDAGQQVFTFTRTR